MGALVGAGGGRVYLLANLAQAFVNVLFGASSVVSQLGLHDVNAVLFGLIRALVTTVCLVLFRPSERLICCGRLTVRKEHITRFCVAGLCLFVGEFFYILGVEFAGSIRASLWQPSQPIWTLAMTWAIGQERMSVLKAAGIVFAFAGCAIMVLCRTREDDDDGESSSEKEASFIKDLVGNAFLFVNCTIGTPLYIITVKPLLTD